MLIRCEGCKLEFETERRKRFCTNECRIDFRKPEIKEYAKSYSKRFKKNNPDLYEKAKADQNRRRSERIKLGVDIVKALEAGLIDIVFSQKALDRA